MVQSSYPNNLKPDISDFNATHAIGFSITNWKFDIPGFKNLDVVREDRKNIKEHFRDLGIE
jgi:hypothetical protein